MNTEIAPVDASQREDLSDKERITRLEVAVALLIQAAIPDNWFERNALMRFVGLNESDAKMAWLKCQDQFRARPH